MTERRDYADRRVPLVNEELSKHSVAIVPAEPGKVLPVNPDGSFEQGSGTCITIGGRFFIATAAHVIDGFPEQRFAVLSPRRTDILRRVINGGRRGGGDFDRIDIGWLEMHPAAAKDLGRSFLPIERIRARCDGVGEALAFYGAPSQDQQTSRADDGLPVITANGSMWATRALIERADLGDDPDLERRIYLDWPTHIEGHDGVPYPLPEAWGMSGGGIWALNFRADGDGDRWRPEYAQLVGIETGWYRKAPRRHLAGYQMHTWLQMLHDDVPELAGVIKPFINAVPFA